MSTTYDGSSELKITDELLSEVCKSVTAALESEFPCQRIPNYDHLLRIGYKSVRDNATQLARFMDYHNINHCSLFLTACIDKVVRRRGRRQGVPTMAMLTAKEVMEDAHERLGCTTLATRELVSESEAKWFIEELSKTLSIIHSWRKDPPEIELSDVLWEIIIQRHRFCPEVLMTIPTVRALRAAGSLELVTGVNEAELLRKVADLTAALVGEPTYIRWTSLVTRLESALLR